MTRVFVWIALLAAPVYGFAQPALLPVGPGDAGARGPRSAIAMPDGRVYEWARNAPPVLVDDLPAATAIAVGGEHVLALSHHGHVFSWGGNDAGQLGDGTNVARRRPVRVRGLANVVRIAAGRRHSLALTADGRVWAWGSNGRGQLGTGSAPQLRAPTLVASLSQIAAIDAGAAYSVAISRSGDVYAWGANKFGQLGDGTNRPRNRPTRLAIGNIVHVSAGATHTLAIDREGAVFSWGSNLRGELGSGAGSNANRPTRVPDLRAWAVRAGRRFSAAVSREGLLMMWGANDAGQLGDGSRVDRVVPVRGPSIGPISTLALGGRHSIAVTAGGDVWTWGRSAVPSEKMTDVADWGPPLAPELPAPPTIAVTVTPQITSTWHTTPVTIAFQCADDSGSVSCPGPVTLTADAALQQVSGTATDGDGNQATASVTVSIDRTPPTLVLNNSPHSTTTTLSQVLLSGRVHDQTSGLSGSVLCAGTAVAIVNDAFDCETALEMGMNHVPVSVMDVAGHITQASLSITRVEATAALAIAPQLRTLLVNELAPLSLHNHLGERISGAAWSSADSRVAAVTVADDQVTVRAIRPGTTMISATLDGLGAEASITVHAGAELPPGTVRWSIAPTPGFTMQSPIFTHRVDPSVPDMFLVESQAPGTATLRAVTAGGELLGTHQSPGTPLMGDSFGGVIAGIAYAAESVGFRAYARLGESGGVAPWRFESTGVLSYPAQAADGTLYALEYVPGLDQHGGPFWDLAAIVIDGRTGSLINRHVFPRDVDTYVAGLPEEGLICASNRLESAPEAVGTIAGSDGRGYFLLRRRLRQQLDSCAQQTAWPQRTIDNGVDLIALSPDGSRAAYSIHAEICNVARFERAACDTPASLTQVAPDGLGGVVAVWAFADALGPDGSGSARTVITRRSPEGSVAHSPAENSTSINTVGQNGIVYFTAASTSGALDVTTGTRKWTLELDGSAVLAAHPDGGAATYDGNGLLGRLDAGGQAAQEPGLWLSMQLPVQAFDSWIGVSEGQLRVVAGHFPDATRFSANGGNAQGQFSVRRPGLGIFAKSHPVIAGQLNFDHVSLRIVPTFQDFWKALKPEDFVNTDEFGNRFMTFGAGTASGDSSFTCTGTLTKGINREKDVNASPRNLEQLPVDILTELRLINDLYVAFDAYGDDLPYACVPERHEGHYNSNSFASGLLRRVQAPLPLFPLRGTTVPGWAVPVPPHKFDP